MSEEVGSSKKVRVLAPFALNFPLQLLQNWPTSLARPSNSSLLGLTILTLSAVPFPPHAYLCPSHYPQKSISINSTKGETHTGGKGFKRLFRRLRSAYNVSNGKDDVTEDML